MNIKENLEHINLQIEIAAKKSGRTLNDVKLLAVSKNHPVEDIKEVLDEGQLFFGENRVQEACRKFIPLVTENSNIKLHLIGQLQTNKVKNIVPLVSCIQSVDRIELLREIEKLCAKINKNINVLLEIHTAEDSKSGFTSEIELMNVLALLQEQEFPHIIPCGFMTMAPFTNDEALIRKSFITLRELRDKLSKEFDKLPLKELSMGMSGDYKIAIEEGATMVRIGTAIFGERNYKK